MHYSSRPAERETCGSPKAACAHHPLAPSSKRRAVDELAPLLGKEGVGGGGCCKELARTPHWSRPDGSGRRQRQGEARHLATQTQAMSDARVRVAKIGMMTLLSGRPPRATAIPPLTSVLVAQATRIEALAVLGARMLSWARCAAEIGRASCRERV